MCIHRHTRQVSEGGVGKRTLIKSLWRGAHCDLHVHTEADSNCDPWRGANQERRDEGEDETEWRRVGGKSTHRALDTQCECLDRLIDRKEPAYSN